MPDEIPRPSGMRLRPPRAVGSTPPGSYKQGAAGTIQATLASRNVKLFGITEQEIESLASDSRRRTVFFSVGSVLFSVAGTIWLSVQIEANGVVGNLDPVIQALYRYGTPLALLAGSVFYVLGGLALWDSHKTIKTIKKESS